MIIQPKFRGFICTTAHPKGCADHVDGQIAYASAKGKLSGPKNVLVIGSSTGYGLASRIVAAFGCGASTLGVAFERPAGNGRTATAGWYNTAEMEAKAHEAGLYARTIFGDAFSQKVKDCALDIIQQEMGKVDLVVYSLAAPKRTHPVTGEVFSSVIKPIGQAFENKTMEFHTGEISRVRLEPASEEEIRQTVAVMGGEDWELWMDALRGAGVLADDAVTVAFSYVGPNLTRPIYRDGTIGRAKDDLEAASKRIHEKIAPAGGRAFVSINKALVTQASSAIPVVPLYISILYKVMKEMGLHEGCVEQMDRMFRDRIYAANTPVDEKGRLRLDDLEMLEDVQAKVNAAWEAVETANITEYADKEGFHQDFFTLFGFHPGLDLSADVDPEVEIPGVIML